MSSTLLRLLRMVAAFVLLLCLPFYILVRGSVYFYLIGWTGYLALFFASLVAVILLLAYLIVIDKWLSRKLLIPFRIKLMTVLVMVVLFNGYALFMFSNEHAKTDKVAGEFTSVHPLLRIAVNTVSFVDRSLIVTDMNRQKADYYKMGLTPFERSLHFVQPDGYVHAIDVRTKGHGVVRNWVIEKLFRLLGFATLRHVGNADHLHISLPRVKLH